MVLGIPPSRPETGYGYIERRNIAVCGREAFLLTRSGASRKSRCCRSRKKYVSSGKYLMERGNVFLARLDIPREIWSDFFLPRMMRLQELSQVNRYATVRAALQRIYPPTGKYFRGLRHHGTGHACGRNISSVFVIPAKVGWSDIGSWAAVYELLAAKPRRECFRRLSFALDAEGNYFWSPKKFVAAIGVRDLVLVETDDALLLCPRDRSQDVGKIVKWLEEQRIRRLL